jgi:hypothetical protein
VLRIPQGSTLGYLCSTCSLEIFVQPFKVSCIC